MAAGRDAARGTSIRSTMPLASRHQGTTILVHLRLQLGTRTISAVRYGGLLTFTQCVGYVRKNDSIRLALCK
jgi:hypothetical protein